VPATAQSTQKVHLASSQNQQVACFQCREYFDSLREEDPLSRTERRRVRESAAGLCPTTDSLDEIQLHRLPAPAPPAFTTRFDVREARKRLPPREDRVIALLYPFDWQSCEVATELRVNESRVSRIKQRAISKLRLQLETGRTRRAA